MAASIRVGNELGAGNPSGAKKVSFVAIGCIREYITLYMFILNGVILFLLLQCAFVFRTQ